MPIYEYVCKACNAKFERLVKSMNGKERIKCPQCSSARTAREHSVFAVGAASPKPAAAPGRCHGCADSGTCPMSGM